MFAFIRVLILQDVLFLLENKNKNKFLYKAIWEFVFFCLQKRKHKYYVKHLQTALFKNNMKMFRIVFG